MSEEEQKVCGIVMPISSVDNCSESHWKDVLEIITEAINDAGFNGELVSRSDDVGSIHKRIIQNLYDNPIVVCDVSGKNPNVMFELGMRLAFDKPAIIIKDNKTSYSFDTSSIEHLEYPRDLRFSTINEFKSKLTQKIKATYQKSVNDPNYTTFLKHFGEFTVAKIDKKEVTGQEYIIEEIRSLKNSISKMNRNTSFINTPNEHVTLLDICLKGEISSDEVDHVVNYLIADGCDADVQHRGRRHCHINVRLNNSSDKDSVKSRIYSCFKDATVTIHSR